MRPLSLCSVLGALCFLAACRGVSPIGQRIPVGTGPFAVLVGEGADQQTDLFAFEPSGGEVVRFTFTRGREAGTAIHPAGVVVASAADGTISSPLIGQRGRLRSGVTFWSHFRDGVGSTPGR